MNIIKKTKKNFEDFINQNLYVRIAYCKFSEEKGYLFGFQSNAVYVSSRDNTFLEKTIRDAIKSTIAMNARKIESFKKGEGSFYDFKASVFSVWQSSKFDTYNFVKLESYDLSEDYDSDLNQSLKSLVLISLAFKEWIEKKSDSYFRFNGIDKEKIDLRMLELIVEENQDMIKLLEKDALKREQETIEFFEKNPDFSSICMWLVLKCKNPLVFL